jgi:hypothetical protein
MRLKLGPGWFWYWLGVATGLAAMTVAAVVDSIRSGCGS